MDNTTTLERLNGQITALIGALRQARDESSRLSDELTACQNVANQRDARVNELEEQLGLKDMELEDLAIRIEDVLSSDSGGDSNSAGDTATEPTPAPIQNADMMQPA